MFFTIKWAVCLPLLLVAWALAVIGGLEWLVDGDARWDLAAIGSGLLFAAFVALAAGYMLRPTAE